MKKYEIVLSRFQHWLRTDPHAGGKACSSTECPVANFIQHERRYDRIHVGKMFWTLKGDDPERGELPDWATNFIRLVDAMPSGEVAPGVCLALLNRALRRTTEQRRGKS